MNFQSLSHQPPFALDRELDRSQFAEGLRPTVSILVRNPSGAVVLVCPRKAIAHENAFMFPQGAIERHETPRAAAVRVLRQECAFTEGMLEVVQAQALGISPIESTAVGTKTHYVVFMSLRKKGNPILNFENQSYLYVTGPNFLWSKISGCRPPKRKMIVTAITAAIHAKLLCSDRWRLERFGNVRGYVTAPVD